MTMIHDAYINALLADAAYVKDVSGMRGTAFVGGFR